MKRQLALLLTAASITLPAHAADTACAPVLKAVRAGMAQARIHAAIDHPLDPEALKMGMKPTLVHSIVIDKLQYSNAIRPSFSKTALDSPDMRALATDLAAFEIDTGCKALGAQAVAGRATMAYAMSLNLGRGDARITLWVDTASGLPVRALTDEPDVDIETVWKPRKGKDVGLDIQQRPNGKRVVARHAYLYGNDVKPPSAGGAIDPAALATLQALLKP
jgi:hypothetical protein